MVEEFEEQEGTHMLGVCCIELLSVGTHGEAYKDESFRSFCSDSVKVVGDQHCPGQFTRYHRIGGVGSQILDSLSVS